MSYLFDPPAVATVQVVGESALFPVNRIFCVDRNYQALAIEMGHQADREAPFYFTKSPSTILPTGSTIPCPPGTTNYHYEMEFVVAIMRFLRPGSPKMRSLPVLCNSSHKPQQVAIEFRARY